MAKFVYRNGKMIDKDEATGWYMSETVGIGLESIIKCPIHGIVNATGAMRDTHGKMVCRNFYISIVVVVSTSNVP